MSVRRHCGEKHFLCGEEQQMGHTPSVLLLLGIVPKQQHVKWEPKQRTKQMLRALERRDLWVNSVFKWPL